MSRRELPVRPDLRRLRREARELQRAIRRADQDAIADLREYHPAPIDPREIKLTEAQHVLARSYGVASWARLALACRMTDAICRNDVGGVRQIILDHPALLHEHARGVVGNWGPPMSYAATLGREDVVAMLHELGARDVHYAFDRATLNGEIATARRLMGMGARPEPGSLMGPAETLNPAGMELLLSLGAEIIDEDGRPLAPVGMVLEGYGRNPAGKHRCLELFTRYGVELPDTPPMAVHRGRIDLLERHLDRDPDLFSLSWSHADLYPPQLGCSEDESLALHGTPLAGATLLHMAIDYGEEDIFRWILARGGDPNVRAAVDHDGFGGHTPLFSCVVSQMKNRDGDPLFARLLLEAGADPNARASLRKRLRFVRDESLHEYRNVTPLSWGRRFHDRAWVSLSSMKLIEERGGHE